MAFAAEDERRVQVLIIAFGGISKGPHTLQRYTE